MTSKQINLARLLYVKGWSLAKLANHFETNRVAIFLICQGLRRTTAHESLWTENVSRTKTMPQAVDRYMAQH